MEFHRTDLCHANSGQLIHVTTIGVNRYCDTTRQVVANLKYHSQKDCALVMAKSLASVVSSVDRPHIVTWIPTCDSHRELRGFDHAELIARHTGAFIKISAVRALRRTTDSHQTGQSRESRLNNVNFVASPRVRHKHVWVIDDVWTTGATFRAATQALVSAGASRITCLAYAHVE